MFYKTRCSALSCSTTLLLWIFTENSWKITIKEFIFIRVAGLQSETLLKYELHCECFSRILSTSAEHFFEEQLSVVFSRTYLIEHFLMDASKRKRTTEIFILLTKSIHLFFVSSAFMLDRYSRELLQTQFLLNSYLTYVLR